MSTHEPSSEPLREPRLREVARLRIYRIPLMLGLIILGFHAMRVPFGETSRQAAASPNQSDHDANTNNAEVTLPPATPQQSPTDAPRSDEPVPSSPSVDLHQAVAQSVEKTVSPEGAANFENPDVRPPASADVATLFSGIAEVARKMFPEPESRWESVSESLTPPESEEAVATIVLLNSLESEYDFSFLLNGDVQTLHPGESHVVTEAEECLIQFHRGGDFGDAEQRLTTGVYEFSATPTGWQLQNVSEK